MGFRYGAVLKIRKYKEDLLKEEVAKILAGIEFEENILMAIEDEIDKSLDEMSSFAKGKISIFDLKWWNNYIIGLKERQKEQKKRIIDLKNELDNARKRLISASQEKRIIERLKEKYEIYERMEGEKREEMELDEIGISLFKRGLNVLSFKE